MYLCIWRRFFLVFLVGVRSFYHRQTEMLYIQPSAPKSSHLNLLIVLHYNGLFLLSLGCILCNYATVLTTLEREDAPFGLGVGGDGFYSDPVVCSLSMCLFVCLCRLRKDDETKENGSVLSPPCSFISHRPEE